MKKLLILTLATLTLLTLAGCQNEQSDQNLQDNPANDSDSSNSKDYVDHGLPYSAGPSAAPAVNGPTSALPESTQAQAVTTDENIRLTLPRKTE